MESELEDSYSEPSVLNYNASSDDFVPSEVELSEDEEEEVRQSTDEREVEEGEEDRGGPASNRTRKRKKNLSMRERRKQKRNLGESYKTEKGKQIQAKVFQNIRCNCKKNCSEKVPQESRKNAFQSFWKIGSFSAQNAFLCGLIQQTDPDRHRPRGNNTRPPKATTNHFHIILKNGTSMKVCKKFFLNTYQVSDGRITRALKVVRTGQSPGTDKRGKRIPRNKTSDEDLAVVRQHITSFPAYESHYTRVHNPNRKYLSEDLNIRLMYTLYKEFCVEQGKTPVKENMYRKTFNTEFNLHFHAPHKDTCMKCDTYKNKIAFVVDAEEKRSLEVEHDLHLRKAEKARDAMKADEEKSKTDETFYAFSFDLEKSLAFPKLSCQIAYYKRNCYVYNAGCHELQSQLGFMYCWNETEGSRGSQEIGACVLKHIQSRAHTAEDVVMYSDTCSGQNRNIKMSLLLMRFIQGENAGGISVIDQKFMQSGHSYLPNDCDFASIENYSKGQAIYCPLDWQRVIVKSRKKTPFHLTVMTSDDFLSTEKLEKQITKRKHDKEKKPVNWLKIQWLRYKKTDPFTIFFKETLLDDMPFSEIDITPSSRRGRRVVNLANILLHKLYEGPRAVTQAKKKDMLDLLPFIPPVSHAFFQTLTTSDDVPDNGPNEHETIHTQDDGE